MAPRSRPSQQAAKLTWPRTTELVGVEFAVQAQQVSALSPQYTIGLHAWFLQHMRAIDAELSARLHNQATDKPFTLTGLDGQLVAQSRTLQLQPRQTYRWRITALSADLVAALATGLRHPPTDLVLKATPLRVQAIQIALPATTYEALAAEPASGRSLSLTLVSPTSFRHKRHHLPWPWPRTVFQRYLRRWQVFSGQGDRAQEIAEKWATIIARRKLRDSLLAIAADMDMPYETVKTYGKLARRALRDQGLYPESLQ